MIEHTKIYSNDLYCNAIYGLLEKLGDEFTIKVEKLDNDLYDLKLWKNDLRLLHVINTIDCLYSLVDGYQRAIYDNLCK